MAFAIRMLTAIEVAKFQHAIYGSSSGRGPLPPLRALPMLFSIMIKGKAKACTPMSFLECPILKP